MYLTVVTAFNENIGVIKIFITYKITCTITGKYYIGSHKTDNPNDDYMGSGRLIRESIQKYGIENHVKEILGVFDTRQESLELEHTLVKQKKKLEKDNCLNMSDGGFSFDKVNESGKNVYKRTPKTLELNRLACIKASKVFQEKKKNNPQYAKEIHRKLSEGLKEYYKSHSGTFLGKNHTQETKTKISNAKKGKCSEDKNSQYGTYWITNGYTNMKWSDKRGNLPAGYYKGRKMVTN